MTTPEKSFSRFATSTLVLTLIVILWGAFVRLSGSGDGCGASWPLCQGVLVPKSPTTEMLIEFLHRLSSGLAFLFVVGLFFWSRKLFTKGHKARKWASYSLAFMITESLIGAALVLFELVDESTSIWRVVVLALHQLNTLLLLSSILLTRLSAPADWSLNTEQSQKYLKHFVAAYAGLSLVAVFGVVAALASMLYPAETLLAGVQQDFDSSSPLLIRLRILHPLLAIGVTGYVLWFITQWLPSGAAEGREFKPDLSKLLAILLVTQFLLGGMTWLTQGVVVMKLLHLLLADLSVLVLTGTATQVLLFRK